MIGTILTLIIHLNCEKESLNLSAKHRTHCDLANFSKSSSRNIISVEEENI